MTLDEAKALVRLLRRHLFLASVSRVGLLALVVVGFFGAMVQEETDGGTDALWYAVMFAVVLWILLTMFSVRQIRMANQASVYMSSGRLDLAEEQLKSAIRQFTLHRMGKLQACHNLAVVAHGQKNYEAAAELCDGVISLCGGLSRKVCRLCRILLADCRLFLGDSGSASRAIEPLSLKPAQFGRDPKGSAPPVGQRSSLSPPGLAEQLMLLPIELRCRTAEGDYERAAESLGWKVRLAELLEAPKAALVHALLARACRHTDRSEVATFLQRRAELYGDLGELAGEYQTPLGSAPGAISADNNRDTAI